MTQGTKGICVPQEVCVLAQKGILIARPGASLLFFIPFPTSLLLKLWNMIYGVHINNIS